MATDSVIDFRQWLPKAMRETRWADIVEVFQQVAIGEIKATALDTTRARLFFESMTDEDLRNIAYKFGFDLTQGNGYTATSAYLRKEVRTILVRIQNKTTRMAYPYLFYIFNLTGDVYPLRRYTTTELRPKLDWISSVPIGPELTLDDGHTLDEDPLWTLDNNSAFGTFTRHFLVQFRSQFVESASAFFSVDTMTALLQDVEQCKKATEFPHFEFVLVLTASSIVQTVDTKVYRDEAGTLTTNHETVLVGGDLSQVRYLRFGNGAASGLNAMVPADNPVNGSLVSQQDITDDLEWVIEAQSATELTVRSLIKRDSKFLANQTYSEIAFHDASNNLIMYTKFPSVNWDPRQLTSVQIQASIY